MARRPGSIALLSLLLSACAGSEVDGGPSDAALDGGLDAAPDSEAPDSTLADDAGPDAEVSPISIALDVLDAEGAGASGVTVTVLGAVGEPLVTDAEGSVQIELSGPGVHLLRFSGDAVLTTLLAVDAEEAALAPLEVELFPPDGFELLGAALGVGLDEALGVVRIVFEPAANGGQSATLASGGAFVHDPSGDPVPGSTLHPDALTDVFFVDVEPGQVAPSVAGASAEEVCELPTPLPDGWVVEAGALTWGVATCRLVP